MGLNHGTNIVKDGLVFYVDPANPRSYPGSGTNIDSLNNTITGSLVANAAFNNVNGGVINFDGINDYIEIYNQVSNADNLFFPEENLYSISSWIRVTGGSGIRCIFATSLNGGGEQLRLAIDGDNKLQFYIRYSSGSPYYKTVTGTTVLSNDVWYNAAMSWDGNDIQLYINGIADGSPVSNTTWFGQTGFTWWASAGAAKWRGNPPDRDFQGDIAPLCIYNNKGLSASEVSQNYNALKGRFN